MTTQPVDPAAARRNKRTGFVMATVAAGMVGLGFASVPLYRIFCQATGLNGTVSRAEASELDFSKAIEGNTMQVRFDANHRGDLPWNFRPEHPTDTATIGEQLVHEAKGIIERCVDQVSIPSPFDAASGNTDSFDKLE